MRPCGYRVGPYGHRTNGPIDYSTKPAGGLRIAIGGSTTEEILLDDRKTWPSLLGAHLEKTLARKIEVINTALAGTRTEQQFAAFRDSAAYAKRRPVKVSSFAN
jgi:hypothetical protein